MHLTTAPSTKNWHSACMVSRSFESMSLQEEESLLPRGLFFNGDGFLGDAPLPPRPFILCRQRPELPSFPSSPIIRPPGENSSSSISSSSPPRWRRKRRRRGRRARPFQSQARRRRGSVGPGREGIEQRFPLLPFQWGETLAKQTPAKKITKARLSLSSLILCSELIVQ